MFQYTISQLLQAKKFFSEHPDGTIKIHPFNGWPEVYDREKWVKWFRDCLTAKINFNSPTGRKYHDDWYYNVYRFSRLVNSRCIFDYIPSDYKERFINHPRYRMNLDDWRVK